MFRVWYCALAISWADLDLMHFVSLGGQPSTSANKEPRMRASGKRLVGDGDGRTLYDGVPEAGGAGRKGVVDEDGLSSGTFTEERHLCGDEKKGSCQPCNKGTYCFCQICNAETRLV